MNWTWLESVKPLLQRRPVRWGLAGLGLLLLLTLFFRPSASPEASRSLWFAAQRGPLTISLTESGSLQSRERVIVRNRVEGRVMILSLVDEGVTVRKGDLLVELDSSRFEENRAEQAILVLNAEAMSIQARENLEVTRNQAQANMDEAELNARFARLDLEKYESGEFPQQLAQAEAEITISGEELQRARDTLEWTQKLAAEGHVTRTELQADELAFKRRELDLRLSEGKLRLLKNFTAPQTLEKLKSNIRQTDMAMERVRRKAAADVIRAEADSRARAAELDNQQLRLARILEQIERCRILAPADGMVVYATSLRSGRQQTEPLAAGQEVTERQELIHLPTTMNMIAEVRIPETSVSKVREGMPALIRVDAIPGSMFHGRVHRIGLLPDAAQGWLNPDLKLFITEVHIDSDAKDVRPGMSCSVEIVLAEYQDALHIPVQSVLRVRGESTVYVKSSSGPVARTVQVGSDNNRMVRILSGLKEGEMVLLAPPLSEGEAPLRVESPPDTDDNREPAGPRIRREGGERTRSPGSASP